MGIFATGAMSAESAGGAGSYSDSAQIGFSVKSPETVTLDLLGFNVLGAGFSSMTLTVQGSNVNSFSETFTTLAGAENFFNSDASSDLNLGSFATGPGSITISYSLNYLNAAGSARGFGFNFNVDPPGGTVPEPSTWAMMLLGFAGLGYAAFRRARTTGRALIPE